MKITKTFVDRLKAPSSGQTLYRDDLLKGFGLRITTMGSKSFIVEKRVNGCVKRITLGRYPALTVEMARKEAQKLLGKIATGIDPVAERKGRKAKAITLRQAFNDYILARKALKPTTINDYQHALNQVVPDWMGTPLLRITKDMIVKRHTRHGARSQARANLAMRILRAIFNFAAGEYEDAHGKSLILENPVKRLSHTRAWYRVERRQSVIKRHELAAWYEGLMRLEHRYDPDRAAMMVDYFLLILFTGLRRHEGATLKWDNVDLRGKTLTITETKNHQTHTIPLSDFLFELFQRRRQSAVNEYVFPADGRDGHLLDPRKAMLKVAKLSGIDFTVHDLRRTFITIAESLDIPVYALKRLLNHKMSSDVTAGYVVIDVERLRKPMQMITDYLLKLMGVKPGAKVVAINDSSKSLAI